MGRRAKYLTKAEQDAGAQRCKRASAGTAHGQLLRKAQNHRAYEIRKALAPPKPPKVTLPRFSIPSISAELVALAELPIPQSTHFHLAAQSSEALDDTDYADSQLAKWDCPPPYTYTYPSPRNPDRLSDALHGYRHRCRQKEETLRLHRYDTESPVTFASEVHAELVHRHEAWNKLRSLMAGIDSESIHGHLGMGLLRWEARCICHLEKDLASLQKGSDAFLGLYVERWI